MAEQGLLRTSTKMWWHLSRVNSSSSWLCLFFEKSPLVSYNCHGALSKLLGVKHIWQLCVKCVQRLLCQDQSQCSSAAGQSVCFSCSCERICLSASFTCTYLFLTHSTNPCLWNSEPKSVSAFFFQPYQLFPPEVPPNSVCFASASFDHNSVTQTSVMLLFDPNFSSNRALLTLASS